MGVDYVRKSVADRQSVVTDVTNAAGVWRRELDPSATRWAWTSTGWPVGCGMGALRRWRRALAALEPAPERW